MVLVNDFPGGTDNERIECAIAARDEDGIVVLSPRHAETEPERTWWQLERAILIPENTTVILRNCTVKLSDRCRDNFFRTANCGMGIEFPKEIQNVHLIGEGRSTLVGADHPRSTGDSSKLLACPCPYTPEDLCRLAPWVPEERRKPELLDFWDAHNHSYGTDAGVDGQSQYGDWRNIGVLFANARDFSISNLRIVDSHGWAVSLEACAYGRVEKLDFDATMSKVIDGLRSNMENQDGLDLRNGCHDILISDLTGRTGDDVLAMTAIAGETYAPGGSVRNTHVMHNDWSKRCRDIYNITIRNLAAYSDLCLIVRFLPVNAKIYNVVADGIIDTTPEGHDHWATVGMGDGGYGTVPEDGMRHIILSNILCNGGRGISLEACLADSVISNVINCRPGTKTLDVRRKDGLKNVSVSNVTEG